MLPDGSLRQENIMGYKRARYSFGYTVLSFSLEYDFADIKSSNAFIVNVDFLSTILPFRIACSVYYDLLNKLMENTGGQLRYT